MRTYRDICGIARALDVVGERWALLVVRELLHGPKQFGHLRQGLAGMSQNVLTQRLRELEEAGVLVRRRGLPPASGVVYELTERGRGLEPVLLALGRWGSPLPPGPSSADELSPDALVVALRTTFDPTIAGDLEVVVRLELPHDSFLLTVDDGRLAVERGDRAADAVLSAPVRVIQDLVFEHRPLAEVVRHGAAEVDGDAERLARLLAVFDDHRDS